MGWLEEEETCCQNRCEFVDLFVEYSICKVRLNFLVYLIHGGVVIQGYIIPLNAGVGPMNFAAELTTI